MKKDTYYFSHDYGARNDPKLIKLQRVMGHEGKGIYWDLIEMLYEQNGYLMLSECETYAFALRTDKERILQVINDFALFEFDGDVFFSRSALNRLNIRNEKSEKASLSAQKRWNNANAMRTQCERNAVKDKKVKERIRKDKKGKRESTEKFTPPPSDDVDKFFQELGQDKTESEKFYNYYTANGWTTSNGKAVSNWHALVKNWISRIKTADKSPPVVDKSEKNIKKLAEDNFKNKPIDKIVKLCTLNSGIVNITEVIHSVINENNGLTNDYNFEKHTEKLIKLYLQNKNIEYA